MLSWKDFFVNEWRSLVRSPMAGQTIALRIMWGVLLSLLLVQVTALGYFLPVILRRQAPGADPVTIVNGMLWAYFFGDLIVRIFMTTIPATIIQQYLHCNIGRRTIARYLMVKSLVNPVNAVGLVLWGTFTLANSGLAGTGLLWFFGICIGLCFNTMLILFAATFKRMLMTLLFGAGIAAVIGVMEYVHLPLIRDAVAAFFNGLAGGMIVLLVIPVVILSIVVSVVQRKIQAFMYIDRMAASGTRVTVETTGGAHVSAWRFEWLLIYRNLRLRTTMIMMYIVFGPMMFVQFSALRGDIGNQAASVMPFFYMTMFFTMFSSLWTQLGCMAESTFFDRLAVLPSFWIGFFRRKFFIAVGLTSIGAMLIAVGDAAFLNNRFASNIVALYLYNCGTTIFLILYRITLHRQRFEIATSAFFNYQGQSFSFMDIAVMLYGVMPTVLYVGLNRLGLAWYLNPLLIVIGCTGLLLYPQWMGWIHRSFMKRRYVMMEGFRARV